MRHNLFALVLFVSLTAYGQNRPTEYTPSPCKGSAWNTPGNLNPFIPGYFADPTIRKFGDTYYLYATTDGTGNGYGPAQVWVSKDFRNWKNVILNWPTTEVVWAPDVVQQKDGNFRYYYCEPCNVNVGESKSPLGPWKNMLGAADAQLVPDRYVHNVITLDPQLFRDDDGQEYLYFTTWGIYDGFGCGVARLNPDYKGTDKPEARGWSEQHPFPIAADDFFAEKRLIPNTELKDVFEAPFVFKRNGIYYFTYSSGSCHTDTYRVQYATSTVGPMGPYSYQGEVLVTNEDATIHGPGHHSVLQDGDNYYIVYHRHDIPKAIHGFNRQVCIDQLQFNADGTIQKVIPTHDGLLPASLAGSKQKSAPNLAFKAKATASSCYGDLFRPEYAVDDNNATLWKARYCNHYGKAESNGEEFLEIDLGKKQKFNQVWTQFEYATFFYQYRIALSNDGKDFSKIYACREDNTMAGSPMIDCGEAEARYIRIYITDTQKNGHFPAIWNVKVFNANKKNDPRRLLPDTEGMDYSAVEASYPHLHTKDVTPEERAEARSRDYRVVDINADDYAQGKILITNSIANRCGGTFNGSDGLNVEIKKGKYAFYFDGTKTMESDFSLPSTMTYNAPYSICAWTLNPQVGGIETVAEFTQRRNDLATIEFRQGTDPNNGLIAHNASFENFGAKECAEGVGEWQFWTIVYDGYTESIYLNGELVKEKNSFLMIRPEGNITLGSSFDGANKFSGYLHSLKFYDKPLSANEIAREYNAPSSTTDRITFADKALDLNVDVVTPNYLKMNVTDGDGKPLKTGLLNYTYTTEPSNSPDKVKCSVLISDDEHAFEKVISKEVSVDAKQFSILSHPGEMRLSGSGPDFNANPEANGARILEEIEGDFVVQARVSDFDGLSTHTTPAYNEAGIILIEEDNSFIQNGVFPLYNCGNMLTQVKHGRPQFPVQNGWNFSPYLQLQRIGSQVYARHSQDGTSWHDLPGSPMTIDSPRVKLGIYQTTYTANPSWATLSDFVVYQRMK